MRFGYPTEQFIPDVLLNLFFGKDGLRHNL